MTAVRLLFPAQAYGDDVQPQEEHSASCGTSYIGVVPEEPDTSMHTPKDKAFCNVGGWYEFPQSWPHSIAHRILFAPTSEALSCQARPAVFWVKVGCAAKL